MGCGGDEDRNGSVGTDPVGAEHAADLAVLDSDPDVAYWSDAWSPEQAAAAAAGMARQWQVGRVGKWIAHQRSDGALVGRGGLSLAMVDGKRQLALGWALLSAAPGQGFATEIGRAGLDYGSSCSATMKSSPLPRCTTAPPVP
jgi:[ribosomal protein S5]-alanine N-acetyltransferase